MPSFQRGHLQVAGRQPALRDGRHPGEDTESIAPLSRHAQVLPQCASPHTSHLSALCPDSKRDAGREAWERGGSKPPSPGQLHGDVSPRTPAPVGTAGVRPTYLCCFIRVHSPPSCGSRLYMYKYPSDAPTSSRGIF